MLLEPPPLGAAKAKGAANAHNSAAAGTAKRNFIGILPDDAQS
jgi:hypothetical protein